MREGSSKIKGLKNPFGALNTWICCLAFIATICLTACAALAQTDPSQSADLPLTQPPPDPSAFFQESLMRELSKNGCLKCHVRHGEGGRLSEPPEFFPESESDLGDAGRFPPPLDHVGRKFQSGVLESIIEDHEKAQIRPYLKIERPSYSREVADQLGEALRKADMDPEEKPTPRDGRENEVGRNAWGRALIGAEGLGCIVCHPLNGEPSLGIQSVDLATAAKRLRPEYFRDLLLDPNRFRPGTRMPSFWPEGRPSRSGFGGSTERQIDSLWVYLNEFPQSRLPVGMESDENFIVHVAERPKVLRTFLKSTGTHGLAIGFPEGVHLGFDALNLRWTLVWCGEFIDAEGIWDDRFTPETEALGVVSFTIQKYTPMPVDAEFLGYRLRGQDPPELRYRVGEQILIDSIKPLAGNPVQLSRQIKLSKENLNSDENGEIWWEIANGKKIECAGEGSWAVDGDFLVWIASGTKDSSVVNWRLIENETSQALEIQLTRRCEGQTQAEIHYSEKIQSNESN